MKRGTCLLYGDERELVPQCHLIPKLIHRRASKVINATIYRAQINGVGDSAADWKVSMSPPFQWHAFSKDAEAIFSRLEDYYSDIIFKEIPKYRIGQLCEEGNGIVAVPGIDYHKFKLFFLSILYRCSVSTFSLLRDFSIGQKEEKKLREWLIDEKAGSWDDWTLYLFVRPQDHEHDVESFYSTPVTKDWFGTNNTLYAIGLVDFVAFICKGKWHIERMERYAFSENGVLTLPLNNEAWKLAVGVLKGNNEK